MKEHHAAFDQYVWIPSPQISSSIEIIKKDSQLLAKLTIGGSQNMDYRTVKLSDWTPGVEQFNYFWSKEIFDTEILFLKGLKFWLFPS